MKINNITVDYFDIYCKAWISVFYDEISQISKILLMLSMNKHRYIDIRISINALIHEKETNIYFSLKNNTFDFIDTDSNIHNIHILKNINKILKFIIFDFYINL
jgi:hypothetical protein